MLHLFDTASGRVQPLELRQPGAVSMYVCGPTVYGPPHLGHGRFALVFDVLRRFLEWSDYEVTYVSNVTDIDDKIIQRAGEQGEDPGEFAKQWEAVWWEIMDRLNVARPTHTPHATDYVEQMVAYIGELVDHGSAYEITDGVYFDTASLATYGQLSRQPLESLRAGARVDIVDEKRSPTDFVLWKKAKPGEPAWPSPWGDGRPGWHTECVVMSLDLLGENFDLHGGGQDLAFPHHENERAQAVALGHTFTTQWVHNGFVEMDGEKMSKSLGNVTDLGELIERHDPRAYRLLVLRSHYRSPLEINDDAATDASRALERLDAFARRVLPLEALATSVAPEVGVDIAPSHEVMDTFRERMEDDLDTPGVVDLLFTTLRAANHALDEGDTPTALPLAAAVGEIAAAVGLQLRGAEDEIPQELLDTARRRDEARAQRDFATADALRDEITAAGYVVEDTADGTKVRPR